MIAALKALAVGGLLLTNSLFFFTNTGVNMNNAKDEVGVSTNGYSSTTNSFYDVNGNLQPGYTNSTTSPILAITKDSLGRGSQVYFPSSATAYQFLFYVTNSLANETVTNLGAATNLSIAMFSTANYAITNFVWNANFWLKSCPQKTALVVGNGTPFSSSISGSAVSPRHVLWPVHAGQSIGSKLLFVDDNSSNIIRTVLDTSFNPKNPNTNILSADIEVLLLDSDLPATCHPFKVLPVNFINYLPTLSSYKKVAVVAHTQDEYVGEQTWVGSIPNFSPGANTFNTAFWHPQSGITVRGGDSGGAMMLPLGTNLVLVSHIYGIALGGAVVITPDYASEVTNINAAMHWLSTNNALGTDYQLQTADLSAFPTY